MFNIKDVSDFWRWRGFVTDFIANTDGTKFIFLYSGRQTFRTKSRIIEYDVATDEYNTRFEATSDVEYWSITSNNDFNEFYVLGTEGSFYSDPDTPFSDSPFGIYDSAEPDSPGDTAGKPHIWKFLRNNDDDNLNDPEEFVSDSDSYPPQLAKYLHLGFGRPGGPDNTGNNRLGMLPFSNRLIINNGNLYYLWSNRTQFGVARKSLSSGANSQAILTANRDTYKSKLGHNHGGCAYYIDGSTLYAAFSFIDYTATNRTSNFKVVSTSISWIA